MDRRGFLKTTSAAAALAATTVTATADSEFEQVTAPAVNTKPIQEFRLGISWAENVAGPADLAHRLATRIREASDGRIRLTLDYSNAADAEFVHASEHARAYQHPAFSYFAGLPANAGLDGTDLEAWISTGGGQDLWDRLAADFGDKPLLAGHLGPNPVLWSNREINTGTGLRGLRIAIDGPAAEVARALGADPVEVGSAQLTEALDSGKVDAIEHGATLNAMAIGLPAAARFSVTPSLTPAGTAIALRVRKAVWDKFSQADQALISACAAETYRVSLSEARLAESLLFETLQNRGGIEARTLPNDVSAAMPHLSKAIIAALSGHDNSARRINASYMIFRRHLGLGGNHASIPIG